MLRKVAKLYDMQGSCRAIWKWLLTTAIYKVSPVWEYLNIMYVCVITCYFWYKCVYLKVELWYFLHFFVLLPVSGLSDPEAREQSLVTLFHSLPPVNFKTAVYLFRHLRKWVCLMCSPTVNVLSVKWHTFCSLFHALLFVVVYQSCRTQGGK